MMMTRFLLSDALHLQLITSSWVYWALPLEGPMTRSWSTLTPTPRLTCSPGSHLEEGRSKLLLLPVPLRPGAAAEVLKCLTRGAGTTG